MTYAPRGNFGRRLEPNGNAILHGAGQSHDAFQNYREAMDGLEPLIYMTYVGVKRLNVDWFDRLAAKLAEVPSSWLIPQIGLGMTHDGQPEKHYEQDVVAGCYDEQLDALIEGLRAFPRPVYLRIGYEFNGHWNGYEAETYVPAYRMISERITAAGLDHVARVWCYSPDGTNKDYMPFYPGDEHVDWWSIDTFSVEHFTQEDSIRYCRDAEQAGYPVMIGESTARYAGVGQGQESWNGWYQKYLDFMASRPAVKAFCYINWEWSSYPQWNNWGDSRIETDPVVAQLWREAMRNEIFVHGGDEAHVRKAIGA